MITNTLEKNIPPSTGIKMYQMSVTTYQIVKSQITQNLNKNKFRFVEDAVRLKCDIEENEVTR